jgi:hypothetical protein
MQRENHEGRTDLYSPVATGGMINATRDYYSGIKKDNGKPAYSPRAIYTMQADPRLMQGHKDYVHSGTGRFLVESEHINAAAAQEKRQKRNPRAALSRLESQAPLTPGVKGREQALAAMTPAARSIAEGKTMVRQSNQRRGVPSNTNLYPEAKASGSVKKTRNIRGPIR